MTGHYSNLYIDLPPDRFLTINEVSILDDLDPNWRQEDIGKIVLGYPIFVRVVFSNHEALAWAKLQLFTK